MPQKPTIPRVCAQCDSDFFAKLDAVKNGGAMYCSRACSTASTYTRVTLTCAVCAAPFVVKAHRAAEAKTCSYACRAMYLRAKPSKAALVAFQCAQCDAKLTLKKKAIAKGKRKFCGRTCADRAAQMSPAEQYRARVVNGDGCWGWRGKADRRGYPFFELRRDGKVVTYRAHRLSYELHNGPIPDGLNVLHRCDNPTCTRPDHLFLGTTRDNIDDMIGKARQARGNKLPQAKLTDTDVSVILALLKAAAGQRGGMARIARQFNVSPSSIHDIARGVSWKHVPRP